MSYKINLEALSGIYALPSVVADKHIKLSGAIQLKVLLLGLKNPADINEQDIADFLSVPLPDVVDALNYWADLGVLSNAEEKAAEVKPEKKSPKKKITPSKLSKPSPEEAMRIAAESPKITRLLREAELKFKKTLSPTDRATIVYLCDTAGIDPMLLLWFINFAEKEEKLNLRYVESTALKWFDEGVTTVVEAEKKASVIFEKRSAWGVVRKAMGIPYRMPSAKEEELSYTWVSEYGYGPDILKKAYDACVDATSDFSIPYITKVLSEWHKAGVKTLEDVEKLSEKSTESKKKKSGGESTFNVDDFNAVLNKLPD